MKTYLLAIVIAFGALFGLSVQAAPLTSKPTVIESQVVAGDAVQKVQHWRWGSHRGGHWRWGSRGGHWRRGSHGGWGGGWGWHNRWRSHHRWGSRY
jgi:hypothetical protein